MKVVTGRFAELRGYLQFAISPFWPGMEVPLFEAPKPFKWKIERDLQADDIAVIVEEGRRQVDRQYADLEKVRGRAGGLLTLCLAELAALSAGANRLFTHANPWLITAWALSVVFVLLSMGGAIALMTAKANFTRIDTAGLALVRHQIRRVAATSYAQIVGLGEQTVAARITVLRDGVLLAIVAAILYAAVWPVITLGASNGQNPGPATSSTAPSSPAPTITPSHSISGGTLCLTCTPSSAPSSSTTTRTSVPSPLRSSPPP